MTFLQLWVLFYIFFEDDAPRRLGRIIQEASSPERLKHLMGVYAGPVLTVLQKQGIDIKEIYNLIEEFRKEVGDV